MEQINLTFQDYKDIFIRRKWIIILPTCWSIIIAGIVAVRLPPVYRSTSTILIEEQGIHSDYVVSSVTGYAEKRLQKLKQRIMSSARLMDIINRAGLYPGLRETHTKNQLASLMKENIIFEPISADIVDRRTGRLTAATIAFTISFEGKGDPAVVYKTTEILTSLFLEENLKDREQQARETTTFLEEEQNRLKNNLADIDHRVASFKARNINLLPEVFQANIQALTDLERKIEQLNEQMRSIKEREGYLEAQIAGIPADEMSDNYKRIYELKVQLAHLRTTYSDYYPDIIKLKKEISKLKYNISKRNKKRNVLSDNPSYVVLSSQLFSVRNELESLKNQIDDLEKRKKIYSNRIQAAPQVEEAYTPLVMQRKLTQVKYDDITRKVMEAKVAMGLEREHKGDRFTLIEPAQLPEAPFKPNRKVIFFIGVVLGFCAGIGLTALLEFSDNAVYTLEDISRISKFPVLAEIPEIIVPKDIKRMKNQKLLMLKGPVY